MIKFAEEINRSDDQLLKTASIEPVRSGITTIHGKKCVNTVATSKKIRSRVKV